MERLKLSFTRQTLILLGVLLIAVAILATLALALQQQDLRNRAQESGYGCNRGNQVQIGQASGLCAANPTTGCQLTAYAEYHHTLDLNGDGIADPNDDEDQPICNDVCADPPQNCTVPCDFDGKCEIGEPLNSGVCSDCPTETETTCSRTRNNSLQCWFNSDCPGSTCNQATCACAVTQVTCNTNEVSLSVLPQSTAVGANINFKITGNASTQFTDDFQGAVENCTGNWAVGGAGLTCKAKTAGTSLKWTHTWKNCVGGNCSIACTKNTTFAITAAATGTPIPGTSLTPTPSGTGLSLSLALEGFPGIASTPAKDRDTEPVRVTLRSAANVDTTFDGQLTYSAIGSRFEGTVGLGSTPTGTYTVLIKPTAYLIRNIGSVAITAGSNTPVSAASIGAFLACDLINNNEVDALDLNQIISNIVFKRRSERNTPGAANIADITRDGVVDIFDYNLCVQNFTVKGDRLP